MRIKPEIEKQLPDGIRPKFIWKLSQQLEQAIARERERILFLDDPITINYDSDYVYNRYMINNRQLNNGTT